MRILISGFVVFVIWCVISAWLYNDKLLPVLRSPVPEQTIPDPQTIVADSLAQIYASMPMELLIYFEFDKLKFKSDPQSDTRISDFKSWLEKYPSSHLSVTGHTDLVGTSEYNHELGLRRAQIIQKLLEVKDIPASRVVISSKGENEPVGDYITEEGRAKNRRTEISIKME